MRLRPRNETLGLRQTGRHRLLLRCCVVLRRCLVIGVLVEKRWVG